MQRFSLAQQAIGRAQIREIVTENLSTISDQSVVWSKERSVGAKNKHPKSSTSRDPSSFKFTAKLSL